MTIDYSILGRKLEKLYPYLAKELLTIPDLDDLELIDCLYTEYCSIQAKPQSKGQQTNQRLIFIASVIKLYDPDYFKYKSNIKNGLRKKLSDILVCDPTQISHSIADVKNYLTIYHDFKDEVEYIYGRLKYFSEQQKGNLL